MTDAFVIKKLKEKGLDETGNPVRKSRKSIRKSKVKKGPGSGVKVEFDPAYLSNFNWDGNNLVSIGYDCHISNYDRGADVSGEFGKFIIKDAKSQLADIDAENEYMVEQNLYTSSDREIPPDAIIVGMDEITGDGEIESDGFTNEFWIGGGYTHESTVEGKEYSLDDYSDYAYLIFNTMIQYMESDDDNEYSVEGYLYHIFNDIVFVPNDNFQMAWDEIWSWDDEEEFDEDDDTYKSKKTRKTKKSKVQKATAEQKINNILMSVDNKAETLESDIMWFADTLYTWGENLPDEMQTSFYDTGLKDRMDDILYWAKSLRTEIKDAYSEARTYISDDVDKSKKSKVSKSVGPEEFLDIYQRMYDSLLNLGLVGGDYLSEGERALQYDFLKPLIIMRGYDYFTSDREVCALGMALEHVDYSIDENKFKAKVEELELAEKLRENVDLTGLKQEISNMVDELFKSRNRKSSVEKTKKSRIHKIFGYNPSGNSINIGGKSYRITDFDINGAMDNERGEMGLTATAYVMDDSDGTYTVNLHIPRGTEDDFKNLTSWDDNLFQRYGGIRAVTEEDWDIPMYYYKRFGIEPKQTNDTLDIDDIRRVLDLDYVIEDIMYSGDGIVTVVFDDADIYYDEADSIWGRLEDAGYNHEWYNDYTLNVFKD